MKWLNFPSGLLAGIIITALVTFWHSPENQLGTIEAFMTNESFTHKVNVLEESGQHTCARLAEQGYSLGYKTGWTAAQDYMEELSRGKK